MFSRKVCYFFVRSKTRYLEVCIILGRPIKAPQVRSVLAGRRRTHANEPCRARDASPSRRVLS